MFWVFIFSVFGPFLNKNGPKPLFAGPFLVFAKMDHCLVQLQTENGMWVFSATENGLGFLFQKFGFLVFYFRHFSGFLKVAIHFSILKVAKKK